MQFTTDQLLRMFLTEAYRYRAMVISMFVVLALAITIIGMFWPKSFTSTATIFVEQRNVLQPIMGNTAASTNVKDRAGVGVAREVIFGHKVMTIVLEKAGWMKSRPNKIEQDRIMEAIRGRTKLVKISDNLIKISYKGSNAERAFITAKTFSDLLVSESLSSKSNESKEAFDFISKQVKEYQDKLVKAEQQLKEFRTRNFDARPGNEQAISKRIISMRDSIERFSLDLKEAQIKYSSLRRQLSGEGEMTRGSTREGIFLKRIGELQAKMDVLRLSYHDTYPDIVQIKYQITDLRKAIIDEKKRKAEARRAGKTIIDESVRSNPLYQKIRADMSQTKIDIATLSTRLRETKKMLVLEVERAKRAYGGQATLAELTRDYKVNRDIYQDLLKRREKARVTMNIDRAESGLNMKIREPAALPLRPSGLRFMHFVVGGIILAIVLPIGLLYGLHVFDPRVRTPALISDKLKLPMIGSVPHLATSHESTLAVANIRVLGMVVVGAIILIGIGALFKLNGVV